MFLIVDFSMPIIVFVNGLVMTLRKSSLETLSSSLIPVVKVSWIDGAPQGYTLGRHDNHRECNPLWAALKNHIFLSRIFNLFSITFSNDKTNNYETPIFMLSIFHLP